MAAADDSGDEGDAEGTKTPRKRWGNRRSLTLGDPKDRNSLDYNTGDEIETPLGSGARPSFLAKLKNLTSSHGRSLSGWTYDNGEPKTPNGDYSGAHTDTELPDSAGPVDYDSDYSDRRRSYSPGGTARTAPSTPQTPRGYRMPRRRATMTDIPEEAREAAAGRSSGTRPSSFRRLTNFTRKESDPASPGPTSARWKALKAGLKHVVQRKREENKIDKQKSAELVAELSAVGPAVIMLASMFQRDEHGNRRIPILLEQLKIKIKDSKPGKGNRAHTSFSIDLEYGSGLTRMRWTIQREWRDFINLHSRYRLADISNTTFGGRSDINKLPRFPKNTIPYLRSVRGLESDEEESDPEAPANAAKQPAQKRFKMPRRRSLTNGEAVVESHDLATGIAAGLGTLTGAVGGVAPAVRTDKFAQRQRQDLERYLQDLIGLMIFRPDSNRLCKFLELSALGLRLSAENSYHGKEGFMVIRSAKGSDFKRAWNPKQLARRHAPKWFLVRHSYLVCVDSPEEMNIYDVFLVDSDFSVEAKRFLRRTPGEVASSNPAHPQHHGLTMQNSERKLKLLAKNERQLQQFIESMEYMAKATPWSQMQRFDSFAPVRKGVFCQWLVDGRDYMWNVSRAVSMAKDVIYIHDWWLSPELYLRRPAAVSQKWRLDRLLKQKAEEGVKIFVIVYRNIGAAVPIDSAYTKYSLLDLHPNVFVQRSPNQIRQNTFFWAHHEKILIVDHMVAFVGGIDLCFGRWDTPQHTLNDDKVTGFEQGMAQGEVDEFQLWPGKDYSNPRVQDFYQLDKPFEDMYDRTRVPRTPWHDIAMQVVGQPARDLTRHFVQRWNYLLRQRKPSRPTPVLLPPPDFVPAELEGLGIGGTCEVQILRSACAWSLGTPDRVEKSILNAYLKAIETSDHFVYIENQFFITSTELEGTVIENSIGDALVERIIRAWKNDEDWRAVILIPLMPGFQSTVDSQDGSSVRLIMQCQYRSISRGPHSIFGKLKTAGIEPEDFIQFYSLRNWGKIGKEEGLVTEQLYIHAKVMIVDDRIAIIGSANINERSMLGSRDSEVAAFVRDTETILSTMAGQPYRVGKFPHTLRVRLMREHLGIDVDEIMAQEREEQHEADWEEHVKNWQREKDTGFTTGNVDYDSEADGSVKAGSKAPSDAPSVRVSEDVLRNEELYSFNHDVDWEEDGNPNLRTHKRVTKDPRVTDNEEKQRDVDGFGHDNWHAMHKLKEKLHHEGKHVPEMRPEGVTTDPRIDKGAAEEAVKRTRPRRGTMEGPPQSRSGGRSRGWSVASSNRPTSQPQEPAELPPNPATFVAPDFEPPMAFKLPSLPAVNDADIGGPVNTDRPMSAGTSPAMPFELQELDIPQFDENVFADPLNDNFYLDIWHKCAVNNTKIYRQVFRCMPDNEVKTWREYKEYTAYAEKFANSMFNPPAKKGGSAGGVQRNPTVVRQENREDEKVMEEYNNLTSPGVSEGNDKSGINANLSQDHITLAGGPPSQTSLPQHNDNPDLARVASMQSRDSLSFKPSSRGSLSTSAPPQLNFESLDRSDTTARPPGTAASNIPAPSNLGFNGASQRTTRRRRGTTKSSRREFVAATAEVMEKEVAEEALERVVGHLVVWPTEWLVKEEEGGTWLYSIDQLAPLEIYN
ncbi:phospholipase D [Ascobolus immersus RN42]|uniref:Phospholipase n=1 Tax=Ascobolus immersus RN42 TaxID=1160509 RepID=A0A3N4HE88_ASCIM|nr:phospholipase D [Ascobolus immersus RN42]